MPFRVRPPETLRLSLSNDNWLLVKKHLTAGEYRAMLSGYMREDTAILQPVRVGLSKVLTYLIDWSVDDPALAIVEKPDDAREAALNAIDPEDFTEILKAVEEHEAAMEKERAVSKNVQATGKESSVISLSPKRSAGGTTK